MSYPEEAASGNNGMTLGFDAAASGTEEATGGAEKAALGTEEGATDGVEEATLDTEEGATGIAEAAVSATLGKTTVGIGGFMFAASATLGAPGGAEEEASGAVGLSDESHRILQTYANTS